MHDFDEIYDKAIKLIRRTKYASIRHFQLKLYLGYHSASKLADMLIERGVLSRADGNHPDDDLIINTENLPK